MSAPPIQPPDLPGDWTAVDPPELFEATLEVGDLAGVRALWEKWTGANAESALVEESLPPNAKQYLEEASRLAAKNGHAEVIAYPLNQGMKITDALMSGACESKSTGVFQALLEHRWDINSKWWLGLPSLW